MKALVPQWRTKIKELASASLDCSLEALEKENELAIESRKLVVHEHVDSCLFSIQQAFHLKSCLMKGGAGMNQAEGYRVAVKLGVIF